MYLGAAGRQPFFAQHLSPPLSSPLRSGESRRQVSAQGQTFAGTKSRAAAQGKIFSPEPISRKPPAGGITNRMIRSPIGPFVSSCVLFIFLPPFAGRITVPPLQLYFPAVKGFFRLFSEKEPFEKSVKKIKSLKKG